MKNYIYLIALLFFLGLSSCEEHLDITPVTDITSAGFWNSEEDVEAFALSIYNAYRGLTNTTAYSERRADLVVSGSQADGLGDEHYHTLTQTSNGQNWKNAYTALHNCNLLFQKAEEFELDAPKIIADTYLIRALIYFNLIKTFGDVPLVLEPTLEPTTEPLERAAVSQIMSQIKADIDQALALYPDNAINSNVFLSKPAAYAVKADVYMWNGRFLAPNNNDVQTAIDAIDALESTGSVALLDDYDEIFNVDNEDNDEIIFATYYELLETGSNNSSAYGFRQDFLSGGPELYTDVPHSGSAGLWRIGFSPKMEALYNDVNDSRKDANLLRLYPRELDDDGNIVILTDETPMADMITKYVGTWDGTNRTYENNLIQYRWADMLLLRAEAKCTLGTGDKGVSDLNNVRNRAGTGDYSGATDQATLAQEILDERARELCYENKRWEDIIRAGRLVQEIPHYANSYPSGDVNYVYWPIAESVMVLNSELTQTPGY